MEERKNTEDPVAFVQREYLPDLFDVRGDIVVAQHHTFRVARASTGKYDRRKIAHSRAFAANEAIQMRSRTCQSQR